MRKTKLSMLAVTASLAMASMTFAAPIYSVNFDTPTDTVGSAPDAATPSGSQPYAHPSSVSVADKSSSTITVEDQLTASSFSSFGDGQFAVMDAKGGDATKMEFTLPSAMQSNSGKWVLSFDFQRHHQDGDGGNNLALYIYGTDGNSIGLLTMSSSGKLRVYRHTETGLESAYTTNLTNLAGDKPYTIQAIMNLDGSGGGTLDFTVDDGATTIVLDNGNTNAISIGNAKLAYYVLQQNGTGVQALIAVDNITVAVPEPGAIGALGLGGLLLLRRRHR